MGVNKDEVRKYIRENYMGDLTRELDAKLGACPECGDMAVSPRNLVEEAVESGVVMASGITGGPAASAISTLSDARTALDWPEPVL